MKKFSALTQKGQARRLRKMALAALEHYALDLKSVRLLQYAYNAIFRVDTQDGRKFVLRVNIPGGRTLSDIASEMLWLAALRRDTDLVVPTPLENKFGDFVTTVEAPGIPQARRCVVFGWVPGTDIAHRVSEENWEKLGDFAANLHDHADSFVPPPGFALDGMGSVLPFNHGEAIWDSDLPADLMPPQRQAVFREVAVTVQNMLDRMYADPSGLRVLHADLHQGNVRIHRKKLHALDFDDCAMGYPVQDIGISCYYHQGYANAHALKAAFRRGYEARRPWPESEPGQVDAVIAGRELVLVNFLLKTENRGFEEMLPGFLARAEERCLAFLENT